MSISERAQTDFDRFLRAEYQAGDPRGFTLLTILVRIKTKKVDPICSTYLHVIGLETDWAELTNLFAGSGMRWDAAVFFVARDHRTHGPLDNPAARIMLLDQEARISDDRLAINSGHFFDSFGRRLQVEEV